MPDLTCTCCGGKEFYDEAGFYFCCECQTQSQGVQVQEFDKPDDTILVSKTRKVKSPASSSKATELYQITSWECYNYILLGLASELIELGASESIKPTVQTLWFTYLKKIQVLHIAVKRPPSLPAYNNKYDASIIYGRGKKKKSIKRKRTSSISSTGSLSSNESVASRREQSRRKRKMAEAAYASGQQTQSDDALLADISLTSLKSSKSEASPYKIRYNKEAKIELMAHMSKKHMKEHIADVEGDFVCHNMTYTLLRSTYTSGPTVMSQSKLYCILHLALLINKQDMQLADLLRFMGDGSLSYNHYQHFFPEDIDNQSFLNTFSVSKVNRHAHYREMSSKLVTYLDLQEKLPLQNLPALVLRYCKELNLPKAISDLCISFIAVMQVDMKITRGQVPNYEAKAMCIIIFVLKLFFGLDGHTEHTFSTLAREVNESRNGKMFVFDDWLRFLLYRRLVLSKHHFPTQFASKRFSCAEYLDFANYYNEKNDIQQVEDIEYEHIAKLLSQNNDETVSQSGNQFFQQFTPSLTPMHDYLKVLYDAGILHGNGYNLDILVQNFHDSSLDCIVNTEAYLHPRVEHHKGGANYHIEMVEMTRKVSSLESLRANITVDILDEKENCKRKELKFSSRESNTATCSIAEENHFTAECNYEEEDTKAGADVALHKYPVHYHPESKFWLRLGANLLGMRGGEIDEFFNAFSHTFRHLVTEFASIISQTPKDLLMEYNYFESYSCYHHYIKGNKSRFTDDHLRRILKKAKQYW